MPLGIIMTNGRPKEGMMYTMALIYDESYTRPRDFKLIPVVEAPRKQCDKAHKRDRRIVDREDLIYGDTIDWAERDEYGNLVEIVREYRKMPQALECRIFNGETQLLLRGIMSKNRNVLWMCGVWPDLAIKHNIVRDAHPNVAVNAWVTLHMTEKQTLKYKLHSFRDIADRFQYLVYQSAWNTEDDGNALLLDDPVDPTKPDPDLIPTISDYLTGMEGVVISPKIVLAEKSMHKHYCFHRIVSQKNDKFPEVGTWITFEAEHLEFLNIYAIKSVTATHKHKPLPLTSTGFCKITIAIDKDHDYPGFYYSKLLQSYFDDPDNVLEAWLLSGYAGSTLQVGVTATEPSPKGIPRLAIAEITDAKLKKIEDFRDSGNMKMTKEQGVVIDHFGRIHVSRLPSSNFRINHEDVKAFPPGSQVYFSATFLDGKWRMGAVTINQKNPFIEAVTVEDERNKIERIWFSAPLARGCANFPYYLHTPQFGVIDTPKDFKQRRRAEHYTYSNIWVTLNDCHPGEAVRPPVKFKYVGMGDVTGFSKPIRKPIVSISEPDYPELSSDLDDDSDRIRTAENNRNVPTVSEAVAEDVFQAAHSGFSKKVEKMLADLEANREWRLRPYQLLEKQIENHLLTCPECSKDEQFNEECYFAEYLAEVIQRKPDILHVFNSDLLSNLVMRRFRK